MKKANVVKVISFTRGADAISVPLNEVIQVDETEMFGIWNGIYFDIFADEYVLLN